jgi:hypothetical protein
MRHHDETSLAPSMGRVMLPVALMVPRTRSKAQMPPADATAQSSAKTMHKISMREASPEYLGANNNACEAGRPRYSELQLQAILANTRQLS